MIKKLLLYWLLPLIITYAIFSFVYLDLEWVVHVDTNVRRVFSAINVGAMIIIGIIMVNCAQDADNKDYL